MQVKNITNKSHIVQSSNRSERFLLPKKKQPQSITFFLFFLLYFVVCGRNSIKIAHSYVYIYFKETVPILCYVEFTLFLSIFLIFK